MPEEIVESKNVINNTIEGLTLPASAPVTEESIAQAERRLERRRAILGDEVFEKEQSKLKENKKIIEEGGIVEDNVSGANLDDMLHRIEHGEKIKAEVAVAQNEIEAKEAQTTDTTNLSQPADPAKEGTAVAKLDSNQADNNAEPADPSVLPAESANAPSVEPQPLKPEAKSKPTKPTA